MVMGMSVSHGQSSGLENVRSKHRAQEERSVRVHIVVQPHVIQESSVSQLRYEPRLQHCRIRCRVHRPIERVRSNQIIWCHTRPHHHMPWIMFQLLREIGILLWPEHISVARTAIDGTFVTEKSLWAGYDIWECVQQSTAWFIAPIHVAIRQFIHESWALRPHIQAFLHLVSHCWPWHTKLWRSSPCRLHWGTFNGSGNRWTRFQARCLSSTPRPVFNTSKSERSFSQSSSVALRGGARLTHSNTNFLRKKWFQDRFIT